MQSMYILEVPANEDVPAGLRLLGAVKLDTDPLTGVTRYWLTYAPDMSAEAVAEESGCRLIRYEESAERAAALSPGTFPLYQRPVAYALARVLQGQPVAISGDDALIVQIGRWADFDYYLLVGYGALRSFQDQYLPAAGGRLYPLHYNEPAQVLFDLMEGSPFHGFAVYEDGTGMGYGGRLESRTVNPLESKPTNCASPQEVMRRLQVYLVEYEKTAAAAHGRHLTNISK